MLHYVGTDDEVAMALFVLWDIVRTIRRRQISWGAVADGFVERGCGLGCLGVVVVFSLVVPAGVILLVRL
ncbi:MAG: hypothetical protein HYX51_00405 [Chloroflexi bacterium]|nr:hypothetical protein [Chloroflexota bacterium]